MARRAHTCELAMSGNSSDTHGARVLIHTPFGRDGGMVEEVLRQAGVTGYVCSSLGVLLAQIPDGVGALLIGDEALNERAVAGLSEMLRDQPNWSDLPVLVLTSGG